MFISILAHTASHLPTRAISHHTDRRRAVTLPRRVHHLTTHPSYHVSAIFGYSGVVDLICHLSKSGPFLLITLAQREKFQHQFYSANHPIVPHVPGMHHRPVVGLPPGRKPSNAFLGAGPLRWWCPIQADWSGESCSFVKHLSSGQLLCLLILSREARYCKDGISRMPSVAQLRPYGVETSISRSNTT